MPIGGQSTTLRPGEFNFAITRSSKSRSRWLISRGACHYDLVPLQRYASNRFELSRRHSGRPHERTRGQIGAGLIVQGAYGSSRWTELIPGGVTREMLRNNALLVVMSH